MAGRPAYYETPEQMQEGIDDYFVYIKGDKEDIMMTGEDGKEFIAGEKWNRYPEPATITGLALFLGFTDRQSLYDYQKKDEFSCIVKKARTLIECEYEKRLAGQSPTGAIFALKNMGWRDKVETGFTNGEGEDISPVQFYLPDNGRNTNNQATEGLSGESTK